MQVIEPLFLATSCPLPQLTPVEWDHARGPASAGLTLLVFGAFDCPRSRLLWSIVDDLPTLFGRPARVIYRHLPGRSVASRAALRLTERAAAQGLFWAAHTRLAAASELDELTVAAVATSLRLPTSESDRHATWDRVAEHVAMARELEITATPALFVNGLRYLGPLDRRAIARAIDELAATPEAADHVETCNEPAQVFSMVAHELRQSLTTLNLALTIVDEKIERERLAAGLARALATARRQVYVLGRHVDHLAGAHDNRQVCFQPRPEPADLVAIVRTVMASLEQTRGVPSSDLRLDADADVSGCWDAYRVEQIVSNLVGNAMKYAGQCEVVVVVRRIGPFVRIAVRDRGPGMSSSEVGSLFRPHARLARHRQRPGLGLGLYIVRAIAEAHGGRAFIDSEPGVGSTIGVDLPLLAAPSQRQADLG